MARTIVDISIGLENDVISDPEPFAPKIRGASAGWARAVALLDECAACAAAHLPPTAQIGRSLQP